MANPYPDQLGQRFKQKSTRGNINLVAFLAIRDDVTAALEVGYSVKAVWADMRDCKRTEIGYEVFLHYVNRLIRRPQANQPTTRAGPGCSPCSPPDRNAVRPNTAPDGTTPTTAKANTSATPAGFTFNPVPMKNEELF